MLPVSQSYVLRFQTDNFLSLSTQIASTAAGDGWRECRKTCVIENLFIDLIHQRGWQEKKMLLPLLIMTKATAVPEIYLPKTRRHPLLSRPAPSQYRVWYNLSIHSIKPLEKKKSSDSPIRILSRSLTHSNPTQWIKGGSSCVSGGCMMADWLMMIHTKSMLT